MKFVINHTVTSIGTTFKVSELLSSLGMVAQDSNLERSVDTTSSCVDDLLISKLDSVRLAGLSPSTFFLYFIPSIRMIKFPFSSFVGFVRNNACEG